MHIQNPDSSPLLLVLLVMWTVFLIANVAEYPVIDCEIHAHENPESMVFWRNRFEPPFNQRWVILERINLKSTSCTRACAYYLRDIWLKKTRGLQRYLAKAFYLAKPLIEAGLAELEIVPWTLEEHKALISPYYKNQLLDWPPPPLSTLLTEEPTFVSKIDQHYSQNKKRSLADHIRMVDIQTDAIRVLPTDLLRRFMNILIE